MPLLQLLHIRLRPRLPPFHTRLAGLQLPYIGLRPRLPLLQLLHIRLGPRLPPFHTRLAGLQLLYIRFQTGLPLLQLLNLLRQPGQRVQPLVGLHDKPGELFRQSYQIRRQQAHP